MKTAFLLSVSSSLIVVAACSGTTAPVGESPGVTHLPQLTVCGKSNGWVIARLPDGGGSAGQSPSCTVDSDCVGGYTMDTGATVPGKCVAGTCDFDQCIGDTDCPSGKACICMSDTHAPGNMCLATQCRVDSDCGGSGECSPSYSEAGPFYGILGRFCRTPKDECRVDADCTNGAAAGEPGVNGTCVYASEVGHWGCTYIRAAG